MKDKKVILLLSLLTVGLLVFNVTFAFTGPGTLQPGSGGGLLFSSSTFIGIGTTNPGNTLAIYASVSPTLATYDASGAIRLTTASGVNYIQSGTSPTSNSSADLRFTSVGGVSTWMTIQSSTGNVGIGSSTPGYPLTVNGNVYSTGNFIGGLSGALSASNITGPTAFGTNITPSGYVYAFPQAIAVGTTTVAGLQSNMLFAASKVGIGTMAPVRLLHVYGTQSGGVQGGLVDIQETNASYSPGIMFTNSGNVASYNDLGFIGATITSGNAKAALIFSTRNSDGDNSDVAERMRIASNGNVGIGTTGPTGQLNVGYLIDTAPKTYTNGGNEGLVINATRDTSGNNYRSYVDLVAGRASDGTNGGASLRFFSQPRSTGAPVQALTIQYDGNVGIGTTGPGNLLTVSGALTKGVSTGLGWGLNVVDTQTAAAGVGGGIYFTGYKTGTSAVGNFASIAGVKENGISADEKSTLLFYTDTGSGSLSEAMRISSGGNIGIATTTPQYKLSINGSYYSAEVDKGNSGTAITIDWSAGNTQHVILTSGPGTPVALTFTNPQPGARYTLILKQDATGGRTVTWPGTFRTGSAGPITLSTAPNATDYVGLQYNGVDGKYDNVAFNAGF